MKYIAITLLVVIFLNFGVRFVIGVIFTIEKKLPQEDITRTAWYFELLERLVYALTAAYSIHYLMYY